VLLVKYKTKEEKSALSSLLIVDFDEHKSVFHYFVSKSKHIRALNL